MVKVIVVCCPAICCGLTIFTIVALALTFKTLEQGRYALVLSWVYQTVSETVLIDPGLRTVTMGNSLIEYPSTFQYMKFVDGGSWSTEDAEEFKEIERPPIHARTQDGLDVKMELSFQWRLDPISILPMHRILRDTTYPSNYQHLFVRLARASVIETCSNYTADLFFTNRSQIVYALLDNLVTAFKRPESGLSVQIQGCQLQQVLLPPAYNEEIIKTTEMRQDFEIARAERQREQTIKETELKVMSQAVQIAIFRAEASKNVTLMMNQVEVDNLLVYQQEWAESQKLILTSVADDPDPYRRLLNLMELKALQDHAADKVIVNFGQ